MTDSRFETKPEREFLDNIAQDASRIMQLIGPWHNASTEHSVLKEYAEKIKECRMDFCDAIDMSMRTAQDGHEISRDALILCDYLRNKTQPRERIQVLVSGMKAKVQSAHKDCKETTEMFKSVNRGLLKVAQQMQKDVQQKPQVYNGTFFNITLMGNKDEIKPVDFESTMGMLGRATTGLANLAKGTNRFGEWWATVRGELSNVQKELVVLQDSEQRIGIMETKWRLINEYFKRYKDQTTRCRQLYPPDLDEAVTELKSNVEVAMISLYNLQTYLINRNGANSTASEGDFTELRKDLRAQWENLRIYLQRCHAFGADVFMLKEAFGTENAQDLPEFLGEMAASAEELRGHSKDLLGNYISIEFPRVDNLRKSAPGNSFNRASTARPRAEVRDRNLQAFIDTNLAATAPDGEKSLSDFKRALARIYSNLVTFYYFWKSASVICQSYLSANISTKQAEKITVDWTRYQDAIEAAIISITKTSDAVLVEAVSTFNADLSYSSIMPASVATSIGPVGAPNPDQRGRSSAPVNTGAPSDLHGSFRCDHVKSRKPVNTARSHDAPNKSLNRIRGMFSRKTAGKRFGLGKPIIWVKNMRKKSTFTGGMKDSVDSDGHVVAPSPPVSAADPDEANGRTSHAPCRTEESSGSANSKELMPVEGTITGEESRQKASGNAAGEEEGDTISQQKHSSHKEPGSVWKIIDLRNKFKREMLPMARSSVQEKGSGKLTKLAKNPKNQEERAIEVEGEY